MSLYTDKPATNFTTAALGQPLVRNEEVTIWTSQEYDTQSKGIGCENVTVVVDYHAITPDTLDQNNHPFGFGVSAVIDLKDEGGVWFEVGRQNVAFKKMDDSPRRMILVGTDAPNKEEGVDIVLTDTNEQNIIAKSFAFGHCAGALRVRIVAEEADDTPSNPFESVTFSCSVKRYGAG